MPDTKAPPKMRRIRTTKEHKDELSGASRVTSEISELPDSEARAKAKKGEVDLINDLDQPVEPDHDFGDQVLVAAGAKAPTYAETRAAEIKAGITRNQIKLSPAELSAARAAQVRTDLPPRGAPVSVGLATGLQPEVRDIATNPKATDEELAKKKALDQATVAKAAADKVALEAKATAEAAKAVPATKPVVPAKSAPTTAAAKKAAAAEKKAVAKKAAADKKAAAKAAKAAKKVR